MEIASCSNQGGRDYNEDSVRSFEEYGRCCVTVADGLGGHGGGKTASSAAAEWITDSFQKGGRNEEDWIREIFSQANKKVLALQTSTCKMKTTCVSLFIEHGQAFWAHVGDSRLYHFVNGQLATCTLDHSVSQMAVLSGEITREQIRFHEDRNRVLRALGAEGIRPDLDSANLNDEAFHAFLLCTDGFWEYVLEGEMEIDLAKAESPSQWISYMTERLQKRVDGKNDNYSAAAVFYGSDMEDQEEKAGQTER